MKINHEDRLAILENALSWIVVLAMFTYGISKLFQFKGAAEWDTPVVELTNMELMWAFYGRSYPFSIALGIFEVTGGLLLLFKKTRLLGCFFITTILVNVILQDVFYDVYRGALKTAIIYQLILLVLMWMNREKPCVQTPYNFP